MRVVKEAKERRNEILDVAQELFELNGYDATSTNDILAKIGIARGTLYYHFKSKEEILDAVIVRMTSELMAKADKISKDKSIPVLDRITQSIMALNVDTKIGHEVMEQMHKPQNALMHQKMQQLLIDGVVPIITSLMEEAALEGMCDTPYPKEAVEMVMIYSNIAFDDLQDLEPEQMKHKIEAFIFHSERVFGMKQGALEKPLSRIFGFE